MGVRWVSFGVSGVVEWLLDIDGEGEGVCFVELKRVVVAEREIVGRR